MLTDWLKNLLYVFMPPRKRLKRICTTLRSVSGKKIVSSGEAEKHWKLYEKALVLAGSCGFAELTETVIDFDKNFNGAPLVLAPSSEHLINILLTAPRPDIQNLEAAWSLSKRLSSQTAKETSQQKICLELAQKDDANRLISKLQERIHSANLSNEAIAEILQLFLRKNSFEDNTAWKPFFLGFNGRQLPAIHQVYAIVNRTLEAADMAEAAGDSSSALHYLLTVPGAKSATRALALAENLGEQQSIKKAHQRVAEMLWGEERYDEAATHFEQAGYLERASDCYRRSGKYDLAIQLHLNMTSEWQHSIRQSVEKTIQSLISGADFIGAIYILRGVELAWRAKSNSPLSESEADRTKRLLIEVVKTARASFEREIKSSQAQPGAEVFKRWSMLEEAAGNYLEAGLQAELARDYFAASLSFEKAGAFGQALAALDQATPNPDLVRKAELLQAGGDFFMAGLLYERLGRTSQAIIMYEEAGEFTRAADLLKVQIGDAETVFDDRYLSLLTRARRAEELAELCYSKAQDAGRPADERARLLRRIKNLAEQNLIGQKWTTLVGEELPEVEVSDKARFDEHAEGWARTATAEVVACYVDAFGLDLGTTNSVVALYNKRLEKPEVVELNGRQMYPSVFYIDHEGREEVGASEKELLGKSPRAVITKAKRVMGTETKYKAGGQIYRPEEISARLIIHARRHAQDYLLEKIGKRISELASQALETSIPDDWVNSFLKEHPPLIALEQAVITVPAYFNDAQKQATRTAGQLSGIEILRLIHEPTAACIAQRASEDGDETILVIDLGAGTLDLSLVEVGEGVYEVKEIEGDSKLGSADLDDLLYAHFVDQLDHDQGLRVSDTKLQ